MTNIFKYSNIFDPNIHSYIRSYQSFDTNIFGYSFVSKMFIRIYSDTRSCHFLDTNIFGYSFMSKSIQMSHSALCMAYCLNLKINLQGGDIAKFQLCGADTFETVQSVAGSVSCLNSASN